MFLSIEIQFGMEKPVEKKTEQAPKEGKEMNFEDEDEEGGDIEGDIGEHIEGIC